MTKKPREKTNNAVITTIKRKAICLSTSGEIRTNRIGGKLSLPERKQRQVHTTDTSTEAAASLFD